MSATAELWDRFLEDGRLADCPIYDMHGHMGPIYGLNINCPDVHSTIKHLDRAGVRRMVFCAHGALLAPQVGNAAGIEAVAQYPDRLRAYMGVNPNYPEFIERDIAEFDKHPGVFVGFKLLADYHQIPVCDERNQPVWEMANERGLPVLLHTWGGSIYDGYEPVKKAVEKYPNAQVMLGHSLHGCWQQAVDLVKEFPNVYMELCAVLDDRGILEMFVEAVGSKRIVFGTDMPWFSEFYYIGSVLGADITDEDRRNIFYRNAQKMLGEPVE